jgi:NAD(P)-dependent dehydrogenase (short-subunit alcohol dehydrogenase family)
MASITKAAAYMFQPTPAYKISKTALNMLTALYAQEYGSEGFVIIAVSPGVSNRTKSTTQFDKPTIHSY